MLFAAASSRQTAENLALFELCCGSASLSKAFQSINAQVSPFDCALNRQTVHVKYVVGDLTDDAVFARVLHQLQQFTGSPSKYRTVLW